MKNQIKLVAAFFVMLFIVSSFSADAHHGRRNRGCGNGPRIVVAVPPVLGCGNMHRHNRRQTCCAPRNNNYATCNPGRGRGRGNAWAYGNNNCRRNNRR